MQTLLDQHQNYPPFAATLSFSSDSLRKLLFHRKKIEQETGIKPLCNFFQEITSIMSARCNESLTYYSPKYIMQKRNNYTKSRCCMHDT